MVTVDQLGEFIHEHCRTQFVDYSELAYKVMEYLNVEVSDAAKRDAAPESPAGTSRI